MKTFILNDCPFCGMTPPEDLIDTLYPSGTYWREWEGQYRHYVSFNMQQPTDNPCYVMHCSEDIGGCGAQMNADSQQEVIDKWNRRT